MNRLQRFTHRIFPEDPHVEAAEKPSDEIKEKLNDNRRITAIDTNGDEFVVPTLTIKQVLGAIPADCYERNTLRALSYVARDIFFISLFGYISYAYFPLIPFVSLRVVAWTCYCVVQSLFGTGLWILAHECGHSAFSPHKYVNDFVGWVLHSFILVPYFSWQISHSKHHKATGNLQRDMVFKPRNREQFLRGQGWEELMEETPIMTLYYLVLQQLFGWVLYLTTNVTGQPYPNRSKWVQNHYLPNSPVFDKKDFWRIIYSDIGILITLTGIYLSIQKWGLLSVTLHYIIPWFGVNHWLVHITYLQHTDPTLAHYDSSEWNFVRGAACTIDRQFGFIGQHIFHDICETHVLHHFVSRIPFYNGRKGTKAIKEVLGEHYRSDDSNFITSLYRVARSCQFIEGDNGVMMFRNANGVGNSKPKDSSTEKREGTPVATTAAAI
ncbi:hypothetical protein NADFUDRAFT_51938 [Nadsonia fulvescens var. elongata DSM 6958]|uniref:Fatty acid desaturase domain-containing protein n=1 Tax=Nadsonia fulvescens var. elongata DSM 6958 TaxID=857566 RepID=A0A1E3PIU8_9ASCO|nr:hypothetical protein NADFUDRAFT_51938 [Nadsonia fulvescens var. elongata DSM 6958]